MDDKVKSGLNLLNLQQKPKIDIQSVTHPHIIFKKSVLYED